MQTEDSFMVSGNGADHSISQGSTPPFVNFRTAQRAIKTPPFSPDRPALWFAQLEAQFHLCDIHAEMDRFRVAVAQIDTHHAAEVEDLIIAPPLSNPYSQIKSALVARFSKSKEAKLRQLLDGESIGDRSPSSFLRHLKALVPSVDGDVLRAKWAAALTEQTRALLATQSTSTLEQQAELADKLHEIYHVQSCSAITSSPSIEQRLEELSAQVASLSQWQQGNSQRRRSP